MDGRVLAVLLSLLAIKSNPKEVSPFDTHPLIMAFLVLDLIVYGMALKKENEAQSGVHKILIHRICHMTSTLAVVLLVILLVRDLGWSLLAFWIVLQAWETCKSYNQIKLAFDDILFSLARFFRRGASDDGHAVTDDPNQPPVGRQFLLQPSMLFNDYFNLQYNMLLTVKILRLTVQ